MRVLVACEYTGVVREAFRSLGHDTWSCDLRESLINSPYHYRGDIFNIINKGWELMIAHPPVPTLLVLEQGGLLINNKNKKMLYSLFKT